MVITTGFALWLTVAIVGQNFAKKVSRGKEKWQKGFLWASFIGATFAGAAMVDTTLGDWASAVSGFHPLTMWPPIVIMLAILAKDIGADRMPNIPACVAGILLPAWTLGAGGAVGQGLHNLFSFIGNLGTTLNTNLFG